MKIVKGTVATKLYKDGNEWTLSRYERNLGTNET